MLIRHSSKKMAFSSQCVVFFFFLIAGIYATQNILEFELATQHQTWMADHGRTYKDPAEQAHRFMIFRENVKYIQDFNNAGKYSYTLRVNQFADLTAEEFEATYMGAEIPEAEDIQESLRSIKYELPELAAIPTSINWDAKGFVTPVKDQKQCGSCWAFAVVATVESLFAIKHGRLNRLSEQQLVDCSKENFGCKGGSRPKAYEYIRKNGGLTTENNYPYVARNQSCNTTKASNKVVTINGYRNVPAGEQSLMAAVAQQPVSVSVTPPRNWQFMGDGIFDGPCGSGQGYQHSLHAVTVVGYGANPNGSYWIVKNSWGSRWGNRGYIKMRKGVNVSTGLCGIAKNGAYPTM